MMSPPNLIRRLAAIIYDLLLLISILFVATALILPFNAGQAISDSQMSFYWFYLLTISFIFYGWFWTHGGQTLGLRAWNMQVLTVKGERITWFHAFLRFSIAIVSWCTLGLGFFWSLIDIDKRCWHDKLSKTALFHQPKK
jgi:uncharacterized RDD family membrane protein YckC